jgi:hypothetical protein
MDNTRLTALMARYCQLGRLLPDKVELDINDAKEVAEAKIILDEMADVRDRRNASTAQSDPMMKRHEFVHVRLEVKLDMAVALRNVRF